MPCGSCSDSHSNFSYNFGKSNCSTCGSTCNLVDAAQVNYSGPALSCLGYSSGTDLQTLLIKIDSLVCESNGGNWPGFNYYCVTNTVGGAITTQQMFVEGICRSFCDLKTAYTTFTTVTYPAGINGLQSQVTAITAPSLSSCAAIGVITSDSLNAILAKIMTNLCSVNTAINPASASWNTCQSITAPTTIVGGFNAVIAQICSIKATVATLAPLPTFDNTGNCLAGGATDSLVTTIGLLTTAVCAASTFTVSGMTWGCVATGTTLTNTIQHIITEVSSIANNFLGQIDSTYFTVTSDGCNGKILSFKPALLSDKFVGATSSDTSPGYLFDKLVAGTGISLNYVTDPGQVIITNTGAPDHKVLTASADPLPDYLIGKLEGSTNSGLTITVNEDTTNSSSYKVQFGVSIDDHTVALNILNAVANNTDLQVIFCKLVSLCGGSCLPPTGLSISRSTTTTTSSTTTTTTTGG